MFSFDARPFSPVGLDGIGRLVRIIDADTLTIVSRLDNDPESKEYSFHVRLMGIDCAEIKDKNPVISKFAHKARLRVCDILNPKGCDLEEEEVLVYVEILKLDKYASRFVGNVWTTEDKTKESVSETLLREGYAKPFTGKVKKIEWTEADVF